jgi:hypothetical protein
MWIKYKISSLYFNHYVLRTTWTDVDFINAISAYLDTLYVSKDLL